MGRPCDFAGEGLSLRGANVRVVTVLSHTYDPCTPPGDRLEDTDERLTEVERIVEMLTDGSRQRFEAAGAHVEVAHRFGYPADEILENAADYEPDLNIVRKRGLNAAQRWLLGSVSDKIVRHAKTLVLVAPNRRPRMRSVAELTGDEALEALERFGVG